MLGEQGVFGFAVFRQLHIEQAQGFAQRLFPPQPEPEPTPTPSVGNPVISMGITLVNNTGTTVTLDGDIVFIMGNPDHNGNYMGYWSDGTPYTLSSNRTDHIRFSGSSVTLAPGEIASFGGLTWQDADCGASGMTKQGKTV